MKGHIYTVEELMLDASFVSYCLNNEAAASSHWKTIVNDNPDQETTFQEAKKMILALHGGLSRNEVNRQIEKVRQQLQERKLEAIAFQPGYEPELSSQFVVTGTGRIRRKIFRTTIAYAAAACLILFIAIRFFQQDKPSSGQLSTETMRPMSFQSPVGQRKTVVLPDGSTAILNSDSRIAWEADFNKSNRTIQLTGDAFFKVAKDPQKPFVVMTGNIATTALGTEFYVHGRKTNEKNIQVDLLEGKVKVNDVKNSGETSMILLPGERSTYTKEKKLQKGAFDSLYLRTWVDGRLFFNETPVLKAFQQLETWYGIEIKVKKTGLKLRSISGDYQGASLQDILKVICFSIDCRYSFSGNIVTIE